METNLINTSVLRRSRASGAVWDDSLDLDPHLSLFRHESLRLLPSFGTAR